MPEKNSRILANTDARGFCAPPSRSCDPGALGDRALPFSSSVRARLVSISSICPRIRNFTMVGTTVRERRYEASMAKITAVASGWNRYLAVPLKKKIGTNTMQILSVETNAGTAICMAPSRMARTIGFPMARLRWMFSSSTVASSTKMPTASARPPNVMMFSVSPSAPRTMIEHKIESGMDVATTRVLRQLPRKSRIINAVRHAAIKPSRKTPLIAARTKIDWSNSWLISSSFGRVA